METSRAEAKARNAEAVRRYRERHPERVRASARIQNQKRREAIRQWAAENPERRRAAVEKWRANNLDKVRADARTYMARRRAEQPERIRAIRRASEAKVRVERPDEMKAQGRARRAKRRAMELTQRCSSTCCSDAKIETLFAWATRYVPGVAEIDHRVPLALGGHHCAKNLVVLPTQAHREKTKRDQRAITDAKGRSQLLRRWPANIELTPAAQDVELPDNDRSVAAWRRLAADNARLATAA